MIDYTIVVPVYCNEDTLEDLVNQINFKVFQKNKDLKGQVVFCEDGSDDSSFKKLKQIKEVWANIKIIKLTRNFGQIPAILSGLQNIDSKTYIIMSADLQDPVSLINKFLYNHFQKNYHIVCGIRSKREDSIFDKFFASVFYKFLSYLCFPNYPKGGFDYFLISKKVRDVVIEMNQSEPFLQGEILFGGYKTKELEYIRRKRPLGTSKQTFSKKITYFLNGIMGYSFFPIRLMSFLGLFSFIIAIFLSMGIIILKYSSYGTFPLGWASSIILIFLMNGIQMIFLGIIGEYIWRTLSQVRNKPKYFIEEIID